MTTLAEIRQKYPQYGDLSDDDLASGMHRRFYSDMPREDFYAKIGYTPPRGPTTAESVTDAGKQAVSGLSGSLVGVLTAPYRALDWGIEKATGGAGLPDADKMPLYRPYIGDQSPQPETDAGRYARSIGEAVGASAIPGGALVSRSQQLARLVPTTLPRAIGQKIGADIAANPGRAVAADVVAAAGAGVGQEAARDQGFGPTGQAIGGIAGSIAPLSILGGVSKGVQAVQSARASANPHARVAAGLGDQSIDDLASGVATGATGTNEAAQRQTLDILGQEMVRAGGNRQAALQATAQRLVSEAGIAPSTAQDRIRRLASVHRDSELLFGEYPAVAAGNQATRLRQPQNVPDEAASRMDDSGTHQLIDYVANSGSMASSQNVRRAVGQRAQRLQERTQQIVQSLSPGGRTIQDVEAQTAALGRQSSQEYQAAHAPGATNYGLLHGLLRRTVDRNIARVRGRSDDQAQALNEAIDRLYTSIPAGQNAKMVRPGVEDQVSAARRAVREARRDRLPRAQVIALERQADDLAEQLRLTRRAANPQAQNSLTPSLQQLQDARTGIRGQIQAARQSGRQDIAAVLQPLYRDITRLMERSNRTWAQANRRWADMNLDEVAAELGDSLAKTAGPRFREQMREFNRLAPQAQDVVRIHFVNRLLDQLENAIKLGGMDNLGRQFSSQHTRNMIRTILGDAAAVQMSRLIRDANVAARSRDMLKGSQTHVRRQVQDEQDADLRVIQSAESMDWRNWKAALLEKAISFMRERRNKVIGRAVTTPMRDTPAVAENLERMRGALERMRRYSEPRRIFMGLGGQTGALAGAFESNEDDRRPLQVDIYKGRP